MLGFLGGCVALSLAGSFDAEQDATRIVYLREKYQAALLDIEKKYDHVYGEGLITDWKPQKGTDPPVLVPNRTWIEFAFADDRGKFVRTSVFSMKKAMDHKVDADLEKAKTRRAPQPQKVTAYNSKYSFDLRFAEGPPTVRSLSPSNKVGRNTMWLGGTSSIHPATMVFRRTIKSLFAMPTFRIDRVTDVATDAGKLLKFEYTVPPPPGETELPNPPAAYRVHSGWLTVDPEHDWVLREYGAVHTWGEGLKTTYVGHVSYRTDDNNQMVPVKVQNRQYRGGLQSAPTIQDPNVYIYDGEDFQFADFQFGDKPEREFTLSAYGLPEYGQTVPQAVAARSFPWWTVGAAVGFGALALVLRRLARRGQTAPRTVQG